MIRRTFSLMSCLAAVLAAGAATPAAAGWGGPWNEKPFWERDEPVKSWKKAPKAEAPFQAFKPKAKPAPVAQDDDEDEPRPQQKGKAVKAEPKKGGGIVDGGGKPHISPQAPETVAFNASYPAGSIVIDTAGRKLYYVKGGGTAYRYPVAVGKEGFTWTGTQSISRKVQWPDWVPPEEMKERKPELPDKMTGGVRNPLGAVAMYLGNSLYRIHGTSDAKSIGTAASSGCIRMHNAHAVHLSSIAGIGTQVTVVKSLGNKAIASN